MKEFIANFFKGFGMGAANVIPGVSGGTIALITGIFERLVNSLKSFDLKAVKLILKGRFKEFAKHTDLIFLLIIMLAAVASIITIARIFAYLFDNYPVFIWSYFFGLIIASVYFVGKTIEKWKLSVVLTFIAGTAVAVFITLLTPARENSNIIYLFLCGIAGVCSMILPGLSGSFILILMGNYRLVMIDSVNNLSEIVKGDFDLFMPTMKILVPVGIGVIFGLLAFSHFLSWIYRKFKNETIAVLTGFILGSLSILWPWKFSYDSAGNQIQMNEFGKLFISDDSFVASYKRCLPEINYVFFIALGLIISGIASIWIIEKFAEKKEPQKT